MNMRPALGYTLLLAGSMAASLLWFHRDRSAAAGAAPPATLASLPATVAVAVTVPPFEVVDAGQAAAEEQMRVLAKRSLMSRDADEVLAAVRGMAVARTPESLAALLQLLGEYPDARVRLAVITTLGELATRVGDKDGQIRQILRSTGSATDTQSAELANLTVEQLNSLAAGS